MSPGRQAGHTGQQTRLPRLWLLITGDGQDRLRIIGPSLGGYAAIRGDGAPCAASAVVIAVSMEAAAACRPIASGLLGTVSAATGPATVRRSNVAAIVLVAPPSTPISIPAGGTAAAAGRPGQQFSGQHGEAAFALLPAIY